jgi:hypothetical protein
MRTIGQGVASCNLPILLTFPVRADSAVLSVRIMETTAARSSEAPPREQSEGLGPLLRAAACVLELAGRTLPITVLNRALFYLEADALLEKGEALTGAKYVALHHGPVVESYATELVNASTENTLPCRTATSLSYLVTAMRRFARVTSQKPP